MDESKRTSRAVVLSALLHLGLLLFLLLATLSCATWESVVGALGLPDSWNPVTCSKPLSLTGPIIQATLLGPTGAPPPPPAKHKAPRPAVPPPKPSRPVTPTDKPKPEPIKTLPPPPKQPDVKDQEKIVAAAQQKAEQAKREQQQREKERMSELEAQQDDIDKIFKQLDAARAESRELQQQRKLEQQKLAQLKDLKNPRAPPGPPDAPAAKQLQSGTNGIDNDAYKAAIQNAVTQNWLRPDNIPAGVVCPIDIVQIPGGQVISVNVEPDCPFNQAGRRSVEDAVMRAQPLPYKGFEKEFQRKVTLNFKVDN